MDKEKKRSKHRKKREHRTAKSPKRQNSYDKCDVCLKKKKKLKSSYSKEKTKSYASLSSTTSIVLSSQSTSHVYLQNYTPNLPNDWSNKVGKMFMLTLNNNSYNDSLSTNLLKSHSTDIYHNMIKLEANSSLFDVSTRDEVKNIKDLENGILQRIEVLKERGIGYGVFSNDSNTTTSMGVLKGNGKMSKLFPESNYNNLHRSLTAPPALNSAQINQLVSSSSDSQSDELCRICHGTSYSEVLIAPCNCRGSLRYVHKSCLVRWMRTTGTAKCQICNYTIRYLRVPRYGIFKSVMKWYLSSEKQKNEITRDLLMAVAMTPIAVASSMMAAYVYDPGPFGKCMADPTQTRQVMTVVGIAVDVSFLSWILVRVAHHISSWYKYYKKKQIVIILLPNNRYRFQ